MDYLKYDGITYEITVLALARDDGFSVELAGMSGDGTVLAQIRVARDIVTLVHQEPLPAEVYEWWATSVTRLVKVRVIDEGADD